MNPDIIFSFVSGGIGIGWFLWLLSKKDNSLISNSSFIVVFVLGFFILGIGISELSSAGSINAILIFESAKEPIAQAAFDHLHSTFDPTLINGYVQMLIGSLILATGFTKLRR